MHAVVKEHEKLPYNTLLFNNSSTSLYFEVQMSKTGLKMDLLNQ